MRKLLIGILAAGSAAFALAGAAWLAPGCANVRMDVVASGESRMAAEHCGECHVRIHDEWAGSPHAMAFIDAEFQRELAAAAQPQCAACHAPETILTDEPLAVRALRPQEGVNCHSCHFTSDCRMAGPNPAFNLHPVQPQTHFYRTSAMCGVCHRETFEEWKLATASPSRQRKLPGASRKDDAPENKEAALANDEPETCQSCHMPAVTRRQTDDPPFDKLHPAYEGRRHTFGATDPALVRDAIKLELLGVEPSADGLAVRLAVANAVAPHRVPTGAYGHREVDLVVRGLDENGAEACAERVPFLADLNTALSPGERRELAVKVRPPRMILSLELEAVRVGRDGRTIAQLGSARFPLGARLDLAELGAGIVRWSQLPPPVEPARPDRAAAVRTRYGPARPGPLAQVGGDLERAARWGGRRLGGDDPLAAALIGWLGGLALVLVSARIWRRRR